MAVLAEATRPPVGTAVVRDAVEPHPKLAPWKAIGPKPGSERPRGGCKPAAGQADVPAPMREPDAPGTGTAMRDESPDPSGWKAETRVPNGGEAAIFWGPRAVSKPPGPMLCLVVPKGRTSAGGDIMPPPGVWNCLEAGKTCEKFGSAKN